MPAISPAGAVRYRLPDVTSSEPDAFKTRDEVVRELYEEQLYEACFNHPRPPAPARVLAYKPSSENSQTLVEEYREKERARSSIDSRLQRYCTRVISAFRVLDAPNLLDDFYLTPLSAAPTGHNRFSLILDNKIYIWSSAGTEVTELSGLPRRARPTSVNWHSITNLLFTGFDASLAKVYDLSAMKALSSWRFRAGRIGSVVTFCPSQFILGTKDGSILQLDIREKAHCVKLGSHPEEVCGLAVNPDGFHVASGGNDNCVKIWDTRSAGVPQVTTFNVHKAAVKALAWAPWKSGLLFAGGGVADGSIKLLSVPSTTLLSEEASLPSQVTGLHVNPSDQTLISCHGFNQNIAVLWKYSLGRLSPLCKMSGHVNRIVGSAMMPDGVTFVTASSDETIRFWNDFQKPKPPLTQSFKQLEIR